MGAQEVWGEHLLETDSLPALAGAPWHPATWEKPARHSGTLQLLSDPKYIKMGALTPAALSRSGMNWGVVKIADLSLFSQEKYLSH